MIAIIMAFSFLGCLDDPSPPGADLPRVVVDHVENDGGQESIIHLKGMETKRFDKMTLYLNDTKVMEKNDTFALEHKTNLSEFKLNVFVKREDKRYNFNATFIVNPKKGIIFKVIYYDGETKKVAGEDLPFEDSLNKMEGSE
ncbi:MAG: hypothetical protein KGY76_06850 [Candidatus Thermoplasmatota archaeon]|nr:hypothetical protein [Candidatus Thermoplasmatota archaeon]